MFRTFYGAINNSTVDEKKNNNNNNKEEAEESFLDPTTGAGPSRADYSSSSSHLLPKDKTSHSTTTPLKQHISSTSNGYHRIKSLCSSCHNNQSNKTSNRSTSLIFYMLAYILLFPPLIFLLCRIPATPFFIKPDYPSPNQLQTSSSPLTTTTTITNDRSIESSSTQKLPQNELNLLQTGGPLNTFTYIGTHNSYHMANIIGALLIPAWRYSHESLTNQLNLGIRHLELDIWYNADTKEWEVWHQTVDAVSNSPTLLVDCLRILHKWSVRHGGGGGGGKEEGSEKHFPMWINLDLKGSYYATKWMILPCRWGEAKHSVVIKALHGLEELIASVWKDDGMYTPNDLIERAKAKNATEMEGVFNPVRKAVEIYGWPDVRELAGKSLFQLNLYGPNSEYKLDAPHNVLFVRGDANYKMSQHAFFEESDDANNKKYTKQEEAAIRKNEMGGKIAENFVYFEADSHRDEALVYQNHYPNAIFRAAILRQDLYSYFRKHGNFDMPEPDDMDDPNQDDPLAPPDPSAAAAATVEAEMVHGGSIVNKLRGGRRVLGHSYSDSEIDEAAKKEMQRLVDNGVHLIATDHPGFAAGGPFILRNVLYNGEDAEGKDDEELVE